MDYHHTLVYLHVRRFVREAIQVELPRRLHSAVTGPAFVALSLELRDEFDRTPDLIEWNDHSCSRVVAPESSYEAEHVDISICHTF